MAVTCGEISIFQGTESSSISFGIHTLYNTLFLYAAHAHIWSGWEVSCEGTLLVVQINGAFREVLCEKTLLGVLVSSGQEQQIHFEG